jgi:flotillin
MDYLTTTTVLSAVGVVAAASLYKLTKWVLSLRTVVATNEVHIVQSSTKTSSFGKDYADNGNTYYQWPSWIPVLGVTKIVLPVSVFDLDLLGYEAYDKGRLPFIVDVKAFFRISDSNVAAGRVSSFDELEGHLEGIVQGAVRSMLANAELEEIMSERAAYGEKFTEAVQEQLKEWGVTPVKNIELMDIRDAQGSQVIHNIMAKKKSHIEMESRIEVAKNNQAAQISEIDAVRQVELQNQEAEQQIGLRKAQVAMEVGIANEKASQEVKEQARVTKEKEMAVAQVEKVKTAEIQKQSNIIGAEEKKQVTILDAEAAQEAKNRDAEALLNYKQKESEGVKVEGAAKASAEREMQSASVTAQIELAKEIGSNAPYQAYLINLRTVEAHESVGKEQAKNLGNAEIKIIANAGNAVEGIKSAAEIFTPKGGLNMGAAIEALANTDYGQQLVEKLVGKKETKPK